MDTPAAESGRPTLPYISQDQTTTQSRTVVIAQSVLWQLNFVSAHITCSALMLRSPSVLNSMSPLWILPTGLTPFPRQAIPDHLDSPILDPSQPALPRRLCRSHTTSACLLSCRLSPLSLPDSVSASSAHLVPVRQIDPVFLLVQ